MIVLTIPFRCYICEAEHQFVVNDGVPIMNPLVCSCGEEFELEMDDVAKIVPKKRERKQPSFREKAVKKSVSKARRSANERQTKPE